MAVRKAKGRQPKSAAPSPTVEPAFWDSHVAPFLDRHSVLVVVCLIAIASARIVSTYSELSLTTDEPEHLFAGLEYLSKHVYRSEHPPLARAMIALGPYLDGTRLIGGPQNDTDRVAVIKGTGHVNRTTFLMRLGILPFFWTACVVVYIWTRRFTTNGTGAIAVGLFTLTPPVLAHAGLATTDMALGAWLPAAFLSLLIWAESPTWWNGALLGLTAALSAMSKFTGLGYLPASALVAAILWLAVKRPPRGELSAMVRRRVSTLGLACGVALLSIWGCYGFSYGKVPDRDLFLPAPEFFDALMAAIGHSQAGHSTYLLGETGTQGWWYFFPMILAVKSPIGLLLLSAVGLWVMWKRRSQPGYLMLAAFSLGILLPAMHSHVNIGVRHILPIYCSLSILGALGVAAVARWAGTARAAVLSAGTLIVWSAASGALIHPDYLAYFNEAAGGEPEKIVVDSDLDWGQETKRLAQRLREVHASRVAVRLTAPTKDAALYGMPPMTDIDDATPAEGWNALSPTNWKHLAHPSILVGTDINSITASRTPPTPWFDRISPTERVGALLLYYFPPGSKLLARP